MKTRNSFQNFIPLFCLWRKQNTASLRLLESYWFGVGDWTYYLETRNKRSLFNVIPAVDTIKSWFTPFISTFPYIVFIVGYHFLKMSPKHLSTTINYRLYWKLTSKQLITLIKYTAVIRDLTRSKVLSKSIIYPFLF